MLNSQLLNLESRFLSNLSTKGYDLHIYTKNIFWSSKRRKINLTLPWPRNDVALYHKHLPNPPFSGSSVEAILDSYFAKSHNKMATMMTEQQRLTHTQLWRGFNNEVRMSLSSIFLTRTVPDSSQIGYVKSITYKCINQY